MWWGEACRVHDLPLSALTTTYKKYYKIVFLTDKRISTAAEHVFFVIESNNRFCKCMPDAIRMWYIVILHLILLMFHWRVPVPSSRSPYLSESWELWNIRLFMIYQLFWIESCCFGNPISSSLETDRLILSKCFNGCINVLIRLTVLIHPSSILSNKKIF